MALIDDATSNLTQLLGIDLDLESNSIISRYINSVDAAVQSEKITEKDAYLAKGNFYGQIGGMFLQEAMRMSERLAEKERKINLEVQSLEKRNQLTNAQINKVNVDTALVRTQEDSVRLSVLHNLQIHGQNSLVEMHKGFYYGDHESPESLITLITDTGTQMIEGQGISWSADADLKLVDRFENPIGTA